MLADHISGLVLHLLYGAFTPPLCGLVSLRRSHLPIDGGQAVSLNAAEALEELSFPDHTRFPGRLPPPQAWQPDGNRIFFNARVSDGATNLWVISISAGGARLLGEPQHVTVGNRRV